MFDKSHSDSRQWKIFVLCLKMEIVTIKSNIFKFFENCKIASLRSNLVMNIDDDVYEILLYRHLEFTTDPHLITIKKQKYKAHC